MTDAEWLACTWPYDLLDFVRGRVSPRKLQLFALACCRQVPHLMTDDALCNLVETSEAALDHRTDRAGVLCALRPIIAARFGNFARFHDDEQGYSHWDPGEDGGMCILPSNEYFRNAHNYHAADAAIWATFRVWKREAVIADRANEQARLAASSAAAAVNTFRWRMDDWRASGEVDETFADLNRWMANQCNLLRDIVGNPFHKAGDVKPTANALGVAHAINHDLAFDRLPILADALEDAGCTDLAILDHCRQPGEHVRGCWVVDLVLGKA